MITSAAFDIAELIQKIKAGLQALPKENREPGYVAEIPLIKICSGTTCLDQPTAIAEFFEIELTEKDREFDDGWEIIDKVAVDVENSIVLAIRQQDPELVGGVSFLNDEDDGSYWLAYVVLADKLR